MTVKRNIRPALLAAVLALPCSVPLSASAEGVSSVSQAELVAEIRALRERVEQLETRSRVREELLDRPAAVAPVPVSSWVDRIKFSGDFRYRHDSENVEGRRERNRQRFRLRAGMTAAVAENVGLVLRVSSGDGDPTSTNQSFGEGFSNKRMGIDQAYIDWKPESVRGLVVRAGRMANPLYRPGGSGLFFDGDLNPEGAALMYDTDNLFLRLLGGTVDESGNDDDTYLGVLQAGFKHAFGDAQLTAGGGYVELFDARGEGPFHDGRARGNFVRPDGSLQSAFDVVQGFFELSAPVGSLKGSVFGDLAYNTAADAADTGWMVGARLEFPSGSNIEWDYQDIEANAVLGLFTDSDFAGGGTDVSGNVIRIGYPLANNIELRGTAFFNSRGVDYGADQDYKRYMLEVNMKY